ncbi:hypothetical protein [Paenibacillus fonticola]|nr:hypothetical protein [Paenibacillus fonticola]
MDCQPGDLLEHIPEHK